MNTLIDVHNVSVRYGLTEALSNISCTVSKGDFVGLVGPNGGGKTTLARALLGLIPLHKGKISIFGRDINDFQDFNKVGYLPQKSGGINQLFPAEVGEVVLLGLLSSKKWPKKINAVDRRRVDVILESLGILKLKGKLITELSGGQQQKVLLARALVSEPEILILDEPSTALDPDSRHKFFLYLKELNHQQKTTILLISHDTGYVGKYANKLLYIDRSLLFFGNISDFCASKDHSSLFEKSDDHIIWHQHN